MKATRTAQLLTAGLLALLVAACGDADAYPVDDQPEATPPVVEEDPEPAPEAEPEPDPEPEPEPEPEPTEEIDGPATVARATADLDVHDAPVDGEPTLTLASTTEFGSPLVLLVTDDTTPGWLEVLLPVRPNGTTGWVRVDDVERHEVSLAVEVDLEARELIVRDGDEVVLTTTTAIGDAEHPTPTGRFYVTDKLDTGDPDGPYGPYAIGLSARSDVLTEFAGGDGQVGIHGTNDPSSIGEAASHGCLRVDNDVATQLAHLLPLGTPVTVS